MLPGTISQTSLSESSAIARANADIEDTIKSNNTQVASRHESTTDMEIYNHILHRLPSTTRQWKCYLHDVITDRARRAQRVRNVQENPESFLLRFPIEESP